MTHNKEDVNAAEYYAGGNCAVTNNEAEAHYSAYKAFLAGCAHVRAEMEWKIKNLSIPEPYDNSNFAEEQRIFNAGIMRGQERSYKEIQQLNTLLDVAAEALENISDPYEEKWTHEQCITALRHDEHEALEALAKIKEVERQIIKNRCGKMNKII